MQVYSNGVSEEIIGKAIKKYNIPRQRLVILSKCYGYVGETPDVRGVMYGQKIAESKDYVNNGGLSRTAIFDAVDASLKRLDTPYMDLLQIHRFDPYTPIEETMEALHDLVKSGKVRYLGASSMWAYQFALMQFCAEKNGWTKFVSMQVSRSAFESLGFADTIAEPLQPPLPRRRARDESILRRNGRRSDPMGAAMPRPTCSTVQGLWKHDSFRRREEEPNVLDWANKER